MEITRPKDMTEGQTGEAVKWLVEHCELRELRRRQNLVEVQIREAYEQRITEALEDLRAMERHLQAAVLQKTSVDN
ncbi:MAG: hypothetical protein ACOYIG_09050 [Acetivibrionales bacterium]|jgi:hypothetical protein